MNFLTFWSINLTGIVIGLFSAVILAGTAAGFTWNTDKNREFNPVAYLVVFIVYVVAFAIISAGLLLSDLFVLIHTWLNGSGLG